MILFAEGNWILNLYVYIYIFEEDYLANCIDLWRISYMDRWIDEYVDENEFF